MLVSEARTTPELTPAFESLVKFLDWDMTAIGTHWLQAAIRSMLDHGWTTEHPEEFVALASVFEYQRRVDSAREAIQESGLTEAYLDSYICLRDEQALECGRWLSGLPGFSQPPVLYQRRLLALLQDLLALIEELAPAPISDAELDTILQRARDEGYHLAEDTELLVARVRHYQGLTRS